MKEEIRKRIEERRRQKLLAETIQSRPRKKKIKVHNARLSFKCPLSLREKLQSIADQKGMNKARLIRAILNKYLQNQTQ